MGAAESSDAEGSSQKDSTAFLSTNCCTTCRNPWQPKDRKLQSISDDLAEYKLQIRHVQPSKIRRGVIQSKIHVGMVGDECRPETQVGIGADTTTSTKLSSDESHETESQWLARKLEL